MTKLIEAKPTPYEKETEHEVWKNAMLEEYQSIMKNDIQKIVTRPKDKSIVTSKWVYTIKHAADGSIDKYKEKIVARGFSQQQEIDYDETFAPTSRYTTIRSLISIVASMDGIYIKWMSRQLF